MVVLLLVLLIGMPILEIYLATVVADQIGGGPVLLLLLAGVIVGAWLMRRSWRQRPRTSDSALLVLAGLLLVLPGFVSDAVGLLLLVPPVRALLKVWIGLRVERAMTNWNVQMVRWNSAVRPGEVIQGEVVSGDTDDDRSEN
jgi:UPF0716 protein FxsA